MYEYIDKNLDKIKKNIKAYFQNARLGLLKYDELNKSQIDEEVDDIFDQALNLNDSLIKGLIKDLDLREDDYPVSKLNDRYNTTTKYVFSNEFERKRDRYKENIISSIYGVADNQGKRKDFNRQAVISALTSMAFLKLQDQNARILAQQIEECAVDDERFLYLEEGIKQGVEYIRWITVLDGRQCIDCEEYHNQIFPIDAVPDRPHYGCRCEMEYVSEEELKELEENQYEIKENPSVLPLITVDTPNERDIIDIDYSVLLGYLKTEDTDGLKKYFKNSEDYKKFNPTDLYYLLKAEGYELKPLSHGTYKGKDFEKGIAGYKIVLGGNGLFSYHPKEHSHHGDEYWKISNSYGIDRYGVYGKEIRENNRSSKKQNPV